MAAHWHKSGMKIIANLSCCCTSSAKCCVRTTAISQAYPETLHFRRKCNPIAPLVMASGLLQVSSPSVEKCLPWSHVCFHWDKAASQSIYRFSSNRHFCSCKAPINL